MTSTLKTLSRAALACALVAGFAVTTPALDSGAPLANNRMSPQQARQLSMPVTDHGDQSIRDMPVVRGNFQQHLR